MSHTNDFLAKTNKQFRDVIEAKTPRGLIAAMQNLPAVKMTQAAMTSRLVHKKYTKKIRKITGDLSILVIRDTNKERDNEYVVIRYDSFDDGSCGKWCYDGRFGRKGGTTTDALDDLWYAFKDLVDSPYDMYYTNGGRVEDNLIAVHSQAVTLSKILGTDKALKVFSFCVEDMNGFEVVSTEGVTDDEFGVIVLHDPKGYRYHVGTCTCGRKH